MTKIRCDCGHFPSPHESFTTGYGRDKNGKTKCYKCCANEDKEFMKKYGKIDLYLAHNPFEVTNWPGSLRFKVKLWAEGKHNIAGSRIDVWFTGPDGFDWWGVNYGKWNDILHCKRIKKKVL